MALTDHGHSNASGCAAHWDLFSKRRALCNHRLSCPRPVRAAAIPTTRRSK
jgi:hypothetical protein